MVCYAAKQTDPGPENMDRDFGRGISRGQVQPGFVEQDDGLALRPKGAVTLLRGLSLEVTPFDSYYGKTDLVTLWRRNGGGGVKDESEQMEFNLCKFCFISLFSFTYTC